MSEKLITVFETKAFIRYSKKLIGGKEREALLKHLKTEPDAGDVIPGSGGLRKLRWKRPGMGKRGGVRVIYYFFDNRGLLTMLTIYAKSDKEDITVAEKKEYRKLVDLIHRELHGGDND